MQGRASQAVERTSLPCQLFFLVPDSGVHGPCFAEDNGGPAQWVGGASRKPLFTGHSRGLCRAGLRRLRTRPLPQEPVAGPCRF